MSSTTNLDGLKDHVHVADTTYDLHDDLAGVLMAAAINAVAERGVFHLALSGGSTPEPFYMNLVVDPRFRGIPWQMTHAWIVDERRVDEEDVLCNFRMIRQSLLDHVPMRPRQMHPMPVLLDDPATAYEEELRRVFFPSEAGLSPVTGAYDKLPRMDFVLLGMGDDGHTASLFPESPALTEQRRWIAVNDGPSVTPPPRVTMTYPLINAARQVVVLCTGGRKFSMLSRVSQCLKVYGPDPQRLPITGIKPMDGEMAWYLDSAAAGRTEPTQIPV